MNKFVADLHVHSPFSRATSKKLDPNFLAAWAAIKGVNVLATGDFTHPKWLEQLEQALEPVKDGLFQLKENVDLNQLKLSPNPLKLRGKVYFILSAEISSIYKKNGKVRKIHNLVYVPSLVKARELNQRLAKIGNLNSDGRPILGLDAKHLLEMVLELDSRAHLIPAHVWTPWFSLFGSKSGFDSIEECFEDLSRYVFALETGLSSDPEMNWMWSKLDRFALVSNSDAHSGENLAREANLFQGEISYDGMFYALKREGLGHKFLGTIEFYPEEGKYHLDGHRKCNVVFTPKQTLAHQGICPVCGKKLTVGVLHRVLALADREQPVQPKHSPGYFSLIPLKEILAEILQVGAKTKKVNQVYFELIGRFGSELDILLNVPEQELGKIQPGLDLALTRMRQGKVFKKPGFDGEYGKISLFTPKEIKELTQGKFFLSSDLTQIEGYVRQTNLDKPVFQSTPTSTLNSEQKKAIVELGPVLVIAGPGTGKTFTLIARIQRLLKQGVNPRHVLTVTFTRKAAQELKERLCLLLGEQNSLPTADTLHALAYDYWQQVHGEKPLLVDEEGAKQIFSLANPQLKGKSLKQAWEKLNLAREAQKKISSQEYIAYCELKKDLNVVDYLDLLEFWLAEIKEGNFINPYLHVLVDEVQDLSPLQLELITALSSQEGKGFFAIGDPNQAIYGFRGSVQDVASYLKQHYPFLKIIILTQNYRSGQEILDLSANIFPIQLKSQRQIQAKITMFEAPTGDYEAHWIAKQVKTLLGGSSHLEADQDKQEVSLALSEIGILVRFKQLIPPLKKALESYGIPCGGQEEEVFFREARVEIILQEVEKMLGLRPKEKILIPERILAEGPEKIKCLNVPPFDPFFWQSKAFKELEKLYQQEQGWVGVLNWVKLEEDSLDLNLRAQQVKIITLHASKGLEFEAVFLPCLEDGILPFRGINQLLQPQSEEQYDLEEEKRLFYVGMTRAKRYLFLSFAKQRTVYGKRLHLPRSRFLQLLDFNLITCKKAIRQVIPKPKQGSLI